MAEQCASYIDSQGRNSTLLDFLRVICLCHDVTRVTDRFGKTFLTGPSQDELCLLNMAAETGLCEFIDRDSAVFTIKVLGQIEEYRTVKFFDFTSARKMMTRIVENVATGQVLSLTKGADSAILERCIGRSLTSQTSLSRSVRDQGKEEAFNSEERTIVEQIEDFAAKGFRTLTFGMKPLASAEIDGVMTQEDIECCLTLLGATCVEDLL